MVAGNDSRVLVYDVGGSHISAALCSVNDLSLSPVIKTGLPEKESAEGFIDLLIDLAAQAGADSRTSGAAFAMPGPFDYAEGISWMKHKMPNLYGMNMRETFAQRMRWSGMQVQFLNDAAAFLLGEVGSGTARGIQRVVGITLGTGVGSGYAVGGRLVTGGDGVPPGGEIWNVPFEDGIVEDLISTRAIKKAYRQRTGTEREVAEIAAEAKHDHIAAEVFVGFGGDLGRALRILLHDFAPQVVVLGGGIARSAPLFVPAAEKELRRTGIELRIATLGEQAPLVGAAVAWLAASDQRQPS